MADSAKIKEALRQLDGGNDNHWTAAGEPRLETVRMVAGDQTISRADVETADKGFSRQTVLTEAPAPAVVDEGAPGGVVTGDPVPLVPQAAPAPIAITAPFDAEGHALPTDVPPLPSAPPADGLPTAYEPAMVEGGLPPGQNVEQATADVEGSASPGRPPQITLGTTEQGYNALNSEADDLRDAQASTAPSPNAPEGLGGAPGARSGGLTNEAGSDESTEQRPGEAQLSPVDRGAVGDADAVTDLEARLAEVSKVADHRRAAVDQAAGELAEATAEESRLRVEIEKARPRGGTMPAIQDYFSRIDETASAQAEARQKLTESGVDWKQLERLVKDPVTGNIK